MEGALFIGIDVSQQSNTVYAMDFDGKNIWQQIFSNSLENS